jgi:hypothetical protein
MLLQRLPGDPQLDDDAWNRAVHLGSTSPREELLARPVPEAQGALLPGQPVVELTSGNTGTGLAIVCGIKGYPFVAVMSKGNSRERARMMSALGAEVVLVDQLPGSMPGQVSGGDLELVELEAQRIVKERGVSALTSFDWKAIPAPISCTRRLRSSARRKANSTRSVILPALAGLLLGAPPPSRSMSPRSNVSSSSRQARLCWRGSP